MSTDFRKQFENPQQQPALRPVDAPPALPITGESVTVLESGSAAESLAADERPGAVVFPLNWFSRLGGYGMIAAAFGFVAYTAINGDPEKDLIPILIGCAVVLLGLCLMPASIVVDHRGIHQLWLMGLFEYSILKNAILNFEATSRAQLRRDGKLRFEWRRDQGELDDEFEDVVYVASKYGRRYILHSNIHRGHFAFIETLEKHGITPKGYENWEQFMAQRGVQVDQSGY